MTIPHSRPFLPPLETFQKHTQEIWEKVWLTNHGPKVEEFEKRIAQYLGLQHVSYVINGTMGLQFVLKTLPARGEVITTPYSYVATSSAIYWEGYKPVFVDIEPGNLSINPDLVAKKINSETRAILATHVYGIPSKIEALQEVADAHGLKLFFDAAHCFGVKYRDESILNFGDYSILSLHATKVFHTANGGLVVSKTAEAKRKIDLLRNFGHNGPNNFDGPGINGKNSELNAALGLSILPYADEILATRRSQWFQYRDLLSSLGDKHFVTIPEHTYHNGAYFPLINLTSKTAVQVLDALQLMGIEGRRYFNPSLNTIEYLNGSPCPVSEAISETVICLPLYHTLSDNEQVQIAKVVLENA
jgi:dTDP-4-amino-4,6-dideoxygalactose transaminase